MMNVVLNSPKSSESTKISLVDKNNGQCILKTLPGNETRFALLANLFLSQGQQGRVMRVFAKKRIGNLDFIATMQKALEKNYPDKLVGNFFFFKKKFIFNSKRSLFLIFNSKIN